MRYEQHTDWSASDTILSKIPPKMLKWWAYGNISKNCKKFSFAIHKPRTNLLADSEENGLFLSVTRRSISPIITSSGGTVEERFQLSTSNSWMNRSRRRLIIVTSSVATSLATNLLRTSSRILSEKTWDPTLWTTYKNPLTICTFLRRRWMTEWWMQRVAWCLPRPGSISLILWTA